MKSVQTTRVRTADAPSHSEEACNKVPDGISAKVSVSFFQAMTKNKIPLSEHRPEMGSKMVKQC